MSKWRVGQEQQQKAVMYIICRRKDSYFKKNPIFSGWRDFNNYLDSSNEWTTLPNLIIYLAISCDLHKQPISSSESFICLLIQHNHKYFLKSPCAMNCQALKGYTR